MKPSRNMHPGIGRGRPGRARCLGRAKRKRRGADSIAVHLHAGAPKALVSTYAHISKCSPRQPSYRHPAARPLPTCPGDKRLKHTTCVCGPSGPTAAASSLHTSAQQLGDGGGNRLRAPTIIPSCSVFTVQRTCVFLEIAAKCWAVPPFSAACPKWFTCESWLLAPQRPTPKPMQQSLRCKNSSTACLR